MKARLSRSVAILAALSPVAARASQFGPAFPTHRYPTDESFHLSYRMSRSWTHSNFVASRSYKALDDASKFNLIEHQFIPEFQPNRQLSVGAILNVASAALNPSSTDGISATKLGDQRIFAEFRFFDAPGRSVGLAFMPKFPGYNNPTGKELADSKATHTVLLGDAQVDLPLLLTTEFWPSTTTRIQFDTGFNFRTQSFGHEVPFQFAAGYVNPRVQLELRLRGNVNLGKSSTSTGDEQDLRNAFANSDFAYSDNPWTFIVQPAVEFWITPSFAASFDYSYSMLGNHAPYFKAFAFGLSFRQAQAKRGPRRTFQEVDIGTDQESGQFPGEVQMQDDSGQKESPAGSTPTGDEEF